MRIPYLTHQARSKFYPVVRDNLPNGRALEANQTVNCELPVKGGYAGNIVVEILEGPEFETDWTSSDPTDWSRFPARVRAAATALRDRGNHGNFRISHRDGDLSITRE